MSADTEPCIVHDCGEPRSAEVHDEESDHYEHRFTDDGAPSGYEDGQTGQDEDSRFAPLHGPDVKIGSVDAAAAGYLTLLSDTARIVALARHRRE